MKRFKVGVIAAVSVVGFVVSACGDASSDGAAAASKTVTITQVKGVTEFPVGPTRIVANGYGIDNLLALGIKPVAVVEGQVSLPAPWHGNKLDGVPIIKMPDKRTIPVEEVAKYRPELFVGDSFVVGANYDSLTPVSKVLGGIEKDGTSSAWDTQLEALGRILGKEAEAAKVLADDKANVQAVRKRNPGLEGKSAVVAQYIAASSTFNLVAQPADATNTFFAELGMALPRSVRENPVFSKNPDLQGGRTPVSLEQLPTIGANFMAIYPNGATEADLARLPGYSGLPQVANGTTLVSDLHTIVSMNQPTSLSRAWILTKIEPLLAKVAQQAPVA
ncbi:ABC transporter substrate-binding protein [Tsukamurella sp. PLM1]|uniref:ABC transporter substrate-binding protein n=1 Tax=Tsukamurella sp. PLM1 TaxID=2929795 RepID=UPI002065FBC4|nr:ABC transporter substrate-binding protein [Tsukamurella sp. PLM1]BDH59840.1 ABC transporter substrate-binding protein [Tsukamurella sp. PLM1]